MARVQIELPETWLFQTTMTIRVNDINYGGHLGNDSVLALAHEARLRWLMSHGLSEKDTGGGAGLIMADAAVMYRGEAFLGDMLRIAVGAMDVRRLAFDLVFLFTRPADNAEIAVVKTGMVCFDYAAHKAVRMSAELSAALQSAN